MTKLKSDPLGDVTVIVLDEHSIPKMVHFAEKRKQARSESSYTGSEASVRSAHGEPGKYRQARKLKSELLKTLFPGGAKSNQVLGKTLKRRNTKAGEIKVIGMTKYISVGFYYSGTSNFGCDKEMQFLYKHKDEQFRRYPGHADAINEAIKALVDMVNENNNSQIATTITFGKEGYKRGMMYVRKTNDATVVQGVANATGIKNRLVTPLRPYATILPFRSKRVWTYYPPSQGYGGSGFHTGGPVLCVLKLRYNQNCPFLAQSHISDFHKPCIF